MMLAGFSEVSALSEKRCSSARMQRGLQACENCTRAWAQFKEEHSVEHRRTGQHPFGGGGQTEFCPNGFGGGGGILWGGGSSRNFFRDPYSVGCQKFFPLAPVTYPKFGFFSVNCSTRP